MNVYIPGRGGEERRFPGKDGWRKRKKGASPECAGLTSLDDRVSYAFIFHASSLPLSHPLSFFLSFSLSSFPRSLALLFLLPFLAMQASSYFRCYPETRAYRIVASRAHDCFIPPFYSCVFIILYFPGKFSRSAHLERERKEERELSRAFLFSVLIFVPPLFVVDDGRKKRRTEIGRRASSLHTANRDAEKGHPCYKIGS